MCLTVIVNGTHTVSLSVSLVNLKMTRLALAPVDGLVMRLSCGLLLAPAPPPQFLEGKGGRCGKPDLAYRSLRSAGVEHFST